MIRKKTTLIPIAPLLAVDQMAQECYFVRLNITFNILNNIKCSFGGVKLLSASHGVLLARSNGSGDVVFCIGRNPTSFSGVKVVNETFPVVVMW